MSRVSPAHPRAIIRALERAGYRVVRIRGSHYHRFHEDKRRLVTVPYHNRDLKPSRVKEIAKQADLAIEDLLRLL